MQKKKKIYNEQNIRILNIDRSVTVPSHIEARGKEKISNSDLVNHGFWGAFILIKKYCTGTLFVLITEFLAHPYIWCPRRYLTRLPVILHDFWIDVDYLTITFIQFSSVAQLCWTLCDPMDCSTSGFPVHHQLPEPAQTHVH